MTDAYLIDIPQFIFDYFDFANPPGIYLCNPNKQELFSLGTIIDRKMIARYNSLWELSFKAYRYIDGVLMEYYKQLEQRKYIKVDGLGYFLITGAKEENDGTIAYKQVECKSLEAILQTRKIVRFVSGDSPTGDATSVNINDLMEEITYNFCPDWTFTTILSDNPFYDEKRGFDVSDKTVYDFLVNDVEESYGCVFHFDTTNNIITAESVDVTKQPPNLYMSLNNIIEKIEIEEITDELATRLHVAGGGGLDISTVNPLGNNYVYNFDYYKNTDWMSQELIDKIDEWEEAYEAQIEPYATIVETIYEMNSLIAYNNALLIELKAELAALETELAAAIYGGLPTSLILLKIDRKKTDIRAKINENENAEVILIAANEDKEDINRLLSLTPVLTDDPDFERIWSPELYQEVLPFIIESSYINENIILTENMSILEEQEQAEKLFEKAQEVLLKTCYPKYTFTIDAINFMAIKEFENIQSLLKLGSDVYINSGTRTFTGYLLEIELNYDDLNDFKVTFGNRQRPENPERKLTDIMNKAITAGEKVTSKSIIWDNWTNNYKDTVSSFVINELDAETNPVISGSYPDITINKSGLLARKQKTNIYADYDPIQLWIIKNKIYTTTNGWESYSLLGGTTTTTTTTTGIRNLDSIEYEPELQVEEYGLVLDSTVGKLLPSRIDTGSTIGVNLRGTSASLNVTTGCFVTDVIYANNIYGNMTFGDLTVNNDIMLGGGISVGDTTYNPPTNVLAGLGDGRFAGGVMAGGSTTNITNGDFYSTGSTTTHGITSVGGIDTTTSIRAVGGIYVGSWGTPTTDDIIADGSIEAGTSIDAGTIVTAVGDGRFGGGVYAGDSGTDAPTGVFIATGDVRVDGGISTGDKSYNPDTGNIHSTGSWTWIPNSCIYPDDGTSGLPGYSFASDRNTGFYRHSENNIGISAAGVLRAVFNDSGLFINETTNTFQTYGVTVKLADSSHAFSYKQSGVTHDMTNLAEQDTIYSMGPISTTYGGVRLFGFVDSGAYIGQQIIGLVMDTQSTRSTSAQAPVVLQGNLSDGGGGSGALGSNINTLVIRNYGTTRFIFDSDGDFFADSGSSTFDAYDDIQLTRALDVERSGKEFVKDNFDEFLKYNKKDLEDMGIAYFNEDTDGHVFVNVTRLTYLQNGAIWQLYKKLQKMERALLNAGINPELLSEEV